jgi:hypothetical protein
VARIVGSLKYFAASASARTLLLKSSDGNHGLSWLGMIGGQQGTLRRQSFRGCCNLEFCLHNIRQFAINLMALFTVWRSQPHIQPYIQEISFSFPMDIA